jgi:WD40 repeat protein
VATAGLDACVKIWNTENGELLKTLEGPGEGLDVRLSLSLSLSRSRSCRRARTFPHSTPFVPVVDVASARQRALGRLR